MGPGPAGGIAAGIAAFARELREAGFSVGPGRIIEGVRAVETVGVARRDDVYWALHAVFVTREDQRPPFHDAFLRFWSRREAAGSPAIPLPEPPRAPTSSEAPDTGRSGASAGAARRPAPRGAGDGEAGEEGPGAYSSIEILRRKDFEAMTEAELAEARRLVARIALPVADLRTRRFRADPGGPFVDLRATLRAGLRSRDEMPLRRRSPGRRPPVLVALCDISGSMSLYSRMLLRYLHALSASREHVHTFVFGTRLTDATRHLRRRDPDEALRGLGGAAHDWGGGTRIGTCLRTFNRQWARRLLATGAVVLLVTDGLDRDAGRDLEREIARLHRSCRRLIWLNPLLRFDRFEPLAAGVRAILPHVDELRPAHSLASLEALADLLAAPARSRGPGSP
ncbi:MAG: VWA domain-containing protein [Gemmatimonadota bacterium]